MEDNPSELLQTNKAKIRTVGSMSAATYANEGSKPIEDYCSILVFAEKETEKTTSILILRLMAVTT